jgi:hypothetical protein
MPLVENGQIVEDRYVRVPDDGPIPDRVPVIVSAKRFLAEADALIGRDGSLGVLWPNDRRVAELEPWLGHLALIALVFARCGPLATSCATNSISWCAPASILSRSRSRPTRGFLPKW